MSAEAVRQLADEHAAFFRHELDVDFTRWIEERWAPDIEIHMNVRRQMTRGEWLQLHSAERGFDWADYGVEVLRVIVADDAFVLEMLVTPSLSGDRGPIGPVPGVMIFTVNDGKCVRMDRYVDTGPGFAAQAAAS